MTSKVKKGLLIAGGVILLIALVNSFNSGSGSSDSKTTSNEETSQTEAAATEAETTPDNGVSGISATELYGKYENNEIAAGNQYKGTTINITGTIGSFDKNILTDNPEIRLDSGNYLDAVICEFSQSDADVLASLSKGQKVTINGTIGDYELCILKVKHCKLVNK